MRTLTEEDRQAAGWVLAGAFEQDPLWVVLLADAAKRGLLLERFFRAAVGVAIDRGLAVGEGEPLDGVAVWNRPESEAARFRSFASFLPLAASSFPLKGLKAHKVFSTFARMRQQHAPVEHFYLQTIGVRSSARGTGVASELIRPFLEEADARNAPVWTESVTPENVGFYEHFGFDVVDHDRLDRLGLDLYGFLRQPR